MLTKLKKVFITALAGATVFAAMPYTALAAEKQTVSTATADTGAAVAATGSSVVVNTGSSVTATTGSAIKPDKGDKDKTDKGDKNKTNKGDKTKTDKGDKNKTNKGDKNKSTKGNKSKGNKTKTTKGNKTKTNKGNKTKTTKTKKTKTKKTSKATTKKAGKKKASSGDAAKKVVVVTSTISARPVKKTVRITISHKKQKNAKITGYIVYKKNDHGRWFRKAVIAKTGTVVYIDKRTASRYNNVYCVKAYYKHNGKIYYGKLTRTVSVSVKVRAVRKRVTDRNSPVYGKTLVQFYYTDGTKVENQLKYVNENKFSSYCLYVNKAKQYVTAYGVRNGDLYPLRVFICSPGAATPVGTHKLILKYRWHELMGPCWGQWCSKITSNGIYFHSIFSSSRNSNSTMSVRAYNKLGTTCSHGCVRLQAYAAKWIYDHCKVGTPIIVTNKRGYEPFKKPVIGKLASWHTWDPTDPTAQNYCKKHKCHKYAKK